MPMTRARKLEADRFRARAIACDRSQRRTPSRSAQRQGDAFRKASRMRASMVPLARLPGYTERDHLRCSGSVSRRVRHATWNRIGLAVYQRAAPASASSHAGELPSGKGVLTRTHPRGRKLSPSIGRRFQTQHFSSSRRITSSAIVRRHHDAISSTAAAGPNYPVASITWPEARVLSFSPEEPSESDEEWERRCAVVCRCTTTTQT